MVIRRMSRDREEANLRVISGFNFLFSVARGAERHSHIGLSTAKPNISDQYVVEFYSFSTARDLYCVRPTRRRRLNLYLPASVVSRCSSFGFISNIDSHLFAWIGPAPNGVGFPTLQHHVVAENWANQRERVGRNVGKVLRPSSALSCKQQSKRRDSDDTVFADHI